MTQDHEKNTPLWHRIAAEGIFLEGIWNVTYDEKVIGVCKVRRIGLYYGFDCKCNLISDEICRLYMRCDGVLTDLGVFVPQEDEMHLSKRRAAKQFPDCKPEFSVNIGTRFEEKDFFIPVCADAPFRYLQELCHACFSVQNGVPGVIIKKIEDSPNNSAGS